MAMDEDLDELFGLCTGADYIERIKNNDPEVDLFLLTPDDAAKLVDSALERLGSYIAGNEHLRELNLACCGLDDSKMAALFSGLTSSDTLRELSTGNIDSGYVAFLKSSPNIARLSFIDNESINTECFDLLLESLDEMPNIEELVFTACNIDTIDALGRVNLPKLRKLYLVKNKFTDIPSQALANCAHLKALFLGQNNIGESGFQAIANMLRKENCCLKALYVGSTGMGDAEAEIIAESLKCNNKLERMDVSENDFGPEGLLAFLKLLNDASSMDRTGNSNHTLRYMAFGSDLEGAFGDNGEEVTEMVTRIKDALEINRDHRNSPAAAGRAKVIKTLLNREKRMELSRLQGIAHASDHYLFSGIDTILLPNVLELAVASGSQSEMYQMLLAIAPDLVSLIDRKAMLQETLAKAEARLAAIAAEEAMLTAVSSRVKSQLISLEADEERVCQLSGKKRGRDTTNTTVGT